jgi:AraC-like ligand binding domain
MEPAPVLNDRAARRSGVDAAGPVDGVELFRARLRGRPFSRHRHDVYAIGVTEVGVQAFEYRGTVERSLPGQVYVLHPDELHDGRYAKLCAAHASDGANR